MGTEQEMNGKRDTSGPRAPSPLNPSLGRKIWSSIVHRPLWPRSDADRKTLVVHTFMLHFRPVQVPRRTLRYTHTFGLGGMAAVLFGMLTVTGVLMLLVYEPTPSGAHASTQQIMTQLRFGQLVRGVHFWSANLLVALVILHMLRVFLSWGFTGLRQFNWIIGLALLLCVLASNFTGYLLPWDQLSYWAATIVTGMLAYLPVVGEVLQYMARGGHQVGGPTLTLFYAFHTTLIPVLIIGLMGWHFWRVRKARGVVIPRRLEEPIEKNPQKVLALPHLFLREFAVGLILVAVVLSLALILPPALGDQANAGMSPDPVKAPWYFVGFQEFLLHLHPGVGVTVVPPLILLGLVLLPYLPYRDETAGIWGASLAGRKSAAAAALIAVVLAPAWILLDERVLRPGAWLNGIPSVVRDGVLPLIVGLILLMGLLLLLKRRYRTGLTETVQSAFVFLWMSYLVLTITGIWFRGHGMALIWPGGG